MFVNHVNVLACLGHEVSCCFESDHLHFWNHPCDEAFCWLASVAQRFSFAAEYSVLA